MATSFRPGPVYGIVVPLVEHVFGVQPDAVHRTVTFEPHLPAGWEDVSIEDLPVGSNRISFTRAKTDERDRVPDRRQGERLAFRAEGEAGARCQVFPERQTDLP